MAADIRERSLRKHMSRHGLKIKEDWFVEGVEGPIFDDDFVAFDNSCSLLKKAECPTVLFCGNDEIALQVFSAATSLGLRVPRDLSLVGFADFTAVTEVLRPKLSTVALPYFEMGSRAVELVLALGV